MTNFITLQDIGTYDVAGTYPVSGGEEKTYGTDGTLGSTLNLHCNSIKLKMELMTNDEGQPGKTKSNTATKRFDFGEVDQVGILVPNWTLNGVYDTSLLVDKQDYGRLCHMCMTKGVKKLGVTDADIIPLLGYRDYGAREYDEEAIKTITYVYVRIKSFTSDQITNIENKIAYTLELEETR